MKGKNKKQHHTTLLGCIFEEAFISFIQKKGLEFGKDFIKCKQSRLHNPDFFFPKLKTYIEIKFSSIYYGYHTQDQIERIIELKKKGFEVKTVLFNAVVIDPLQNSIMNNYFDRLIKNKPGDQQ